MCNRTSALFTVAEQRCGEEINTLSLGLMWLAATRGLTPNLCVDAGFSLLPWSLDFVRTWKNEHLNATEEPFLVCK